MKINGIEFDDPDPLHYPKYNYKKYTEGKRTQIQEAWVDSYVKTGIIGYEFASYKITVTNRGAVTFDDKPVKDKNEADWIRNFFNNLKIG